MKAAIAGSLARVLKRGVACMVGAFVLACLMLNLLLGKPVAAPPGQEVAVLTE